MKHWQRLVAMVLIAATGAGAAVAPLPTHAVLAAPGPDRHLVLVAGSGGGTVLRGDPDAHWRRRQNLGSGLSALVADASGRIMYAATYGGGLWRGTGGGQRWTLLTSPAGDGIAVHSLALNPHNAGVIYAGTGSGLRQSLDGGKTWLALSNGLPDTAVYSVAIDPHNAASVWAGTADSGLYHSADGGSTWSITGDELPPDASVMALALSPANSGVIYAGTAAGLYQSVDGGSTWVALGGGLPAGASIRALAVSAVQPSRVYAGTDSTVFASYDGGSTWQQGGSDLPAAAVHTLATDPTSASVAYAATDHGIFRTDDGGGSWSDWSGDDLGYDATLTALALVDVPLIPTDAASPSCCGRYFAQTSHNLSGLFLTFWSRYGGVDTFGYPRTEPFVEGGHLVQYTDRFRLELTGGRIVTAALGRTLTDHRSFPPVRQFHSTASLVYFAGTRHALAGRFLRYWLGHHGAVLLGAPIAEPTREANADGTGRVYEVQWFEKGRLEFHPELAGTRYEVQIGLTGKQDLLRKGWL